MVAVYERNAVLDFGGGRLTLAKEAIRTFYAGLVATGRKFAFGDQRACIVTGDLALTSTRLPDGSVTAEVARRQGDGTVGHQSVLHGVTRGEELRRLGNFQRAQRDLQR
jgi:hypothetical protein